MSDVSVMSGLAGAILGGFAGATFAHWFSGARPSMRLASVSLSPIQPDVGDKKALAKAILAGKAKDYLLVPDDVLQTLRESDYVDSPDKFYQHPSMYTFALFQANRDNEMVRLQHKPIPDVLRELKRLLYAGLIQDFLQTWHPSQQIFWVQMLSEHVRGNFDYPDFDTTPLGKSTVTVFL